MKTNVTYGPHGPAWFRLIRECRPPVIFGEQVGGSGGWEWFEPVCADLEGSGYAVGSAELCAAGFGAPHLRRRLFFVAHADCVRWEKERPIRIQVTGQCRGHHYKPRSESFWDRCDWIEFNDGCSQLSGVWNA